MCEHVGGMLVPCRAAVLRMARERSRGVQPALFPLGLDPDDTRPAVTAWDYRTDPSEARKVAGLA